MTTEYEQGRLDALLEAYNLLTAVRNLGGVGRARWILSEKIRVLDPDIAAILKVIS